MKTAVMMRYGLKKPERVVYVSISALGRVLYRCSRPSAVWGHPGLHEMLSNEHRNG